MRFLCDQIRFTCYKQSPPAFSNQIFELRNAAAAARAADDIDFIEVKAAATPLG